MTIPLDPTEQSGGPDDQMSGWPDPGSGLAGQTRDRGERIMNDMLTPHVTEVVRQGHVVTHPLRLREPLSLGPAAPRPPAAVLQPGG